MCESSLSAQLELLSRSESSRSSLRFGAMSIVDVVESWSNFSLVREAPWKERDVMT